MYEYNTSTDRLKPNHIQIKCGLYISILNIYYLIPIYMDLTNMSIVNQMAR